MTAMRTVRSTASVVLAAFVLGACSDDGPTFPTSFEPLELQNDLALASAAANAPAAESFALMGVDIELALVNIGGGGAQLIEVPALLLDGPLTPTAQLKARMVRSANMRMADALPAEALGTTFVWDLSTSEYVASDAAGAPASGVRFALYAINPLTDMPAEPLNEIGYADLTVSGSGDNATARVQVWSEGVSGTRVLDYNAHVEGGQAEMSGYAKNAQDSLAFSLSIGYSIDSRTLSIDWRTSLPSRELVTRLNQSITTRPDNSFDMTFDAAIVSPSGQVDLDGTILGATGGSLAVKVNGQTFATMTLSTSTDVEPTIVNADGEPLTTEEEETLAQIFNWFSGAIEVFANLLSPVSALLATATT